MKICMLTKKIKWKSEGKKEGEDMEIHDKQKF